MAKATQPAIASTTQMRNRICTVSHSTRVTPRRLNEARQSVFSIEPPGSSDTFLTLSHDALLVAGEFGTG